MPRPLRVEYPGACYHVTSRGVDRCTTFVTDQDRRSFLYLLGELLSRFGVETHAYCLMGNHYHLLVRTLRANLSAAMQRLDSLYTSGFNRRHDRDGPLFRGRYRASLIEAEVYLVRAGRYVHRNPLEAGLVTELDRYRWSSYPAYVGRAPVPDWLRTCTVLQSFDNAAGLRRFVEYGKPDDDLAKMFSRGSPVLGSPEFVKRLTAPPGGDAFDPAGMAPSVVDEIEGMVIAEFEVSAASLHNSVRGQRNVARMAVIAMANRYGALTLAELAQRYGLASSSSAASAAHRLAKVAEKDADLRAQLAALRLKLDVA